MGGCGVQLVPCTLPAMVAAIFGLRKDVDKMIALVQKMLLQFCFSVRRVKSSEALEKGYLLSLTVFLSTETIMFG